MPNPLKGSKRVGADRYVLGSAGNQPRRCGHRHLLRLGLEPSSRSAGHGQSSPNRTDSSCSCESIEMRHLEQSPSPTFFSFRRVQVFRLVTARSSFPSHASSLSLGLILLSDADTIEDKILQRAGAKRKLEALVIQDGPLRLHPFFSFLSRSR